MGWQIEVLALGGILILALGVRVGASVWWQNRRPPDQPFALADSHSYWRLAERVARGEPYAYPDERARIFRTPAYPIVLAPVYWIWRQPPVLSARLVGCLLGVMAVAGVMWLARGWRCSTLTGLLAALYPGAVAMSVLVLGERPGPVRSAVVKAVAAF